MKEKSFRFVLLILILNICNYKVVAQVNLTRVTYKIQTPEVDKTLTIKNKDFESTQEYLKLIECELIYSSDESIFRKVDLMDKENDRGYKLASIFVSGIYYKNLKTNEKIKQTLTFGETFNIKMLYEQFNWKITTESKTINGYLCYKAVADYKEVNKVRNTIKTFNPEVWFAPSIPAPFGPIGLDGLPGLVLEGTFTNFVNFYAVKVNFDFKDDKSVLEKPTKGKFVSEAEYQDILVKLYNDIERQ